MFTLKIKTDNAAFIESSAPCDEVARILVEVADKLRAGQERGLCRDSNGNTVGTFTLDLEG